MISGQRASARLAPRTQRVSLWPLLYCSLAFLALFLVGLTAAVPETAHTPSDLRHLGFGQPFDFVYADMSKNSMLTPAEYRLNPWEGQETVVISWGPFLLDWALLILCLAGPVWVIRRLWLRGLAQLGLER